MKKHRISWPPRRDRLDPLAADLHHEAPNAPATAARELRRVALGSAS